MDVGRQITGGMNKAALASEVLPCALGLHRSKRLPNFALLDPMPLIPLHHVVVLLARLQHTLINPLGNVDKASISVMSSLELVADEHELGKVGPRSLN